MIFILPQPEPLGVDSELNSSESHVLGLVSIDLWLRWLHPTEFPVGVSIQISQPESLQSELSGHHSLFEAH